MSVIPFVISGIVSSEYRKEIPMQGKYKKDCISPTAPYLSHLLKMDNLPLICKHVSGNALH